MYNVLNKEWDRIVVKTIDVMLHRHLSGREFTKDDTCVTYVIERPTIEVIPMERNTEVPLPPVTIEDYTTSEMTKEEAIEKHIEMFGKKPHHKMSTENIIKKLI